MSYSVEITAHFKKQFKRLVKKYPSLKGELFELIEILETAPEQGSSIGNNCYKIRISIASKGKGKSGGARVIINIHFSAELVYLLSIYDKSEVDNISDSELAELLGFIGDV